MKIQSQVCLLWMRTGIQRYADRPCRKCLSQQRYCADNVGKEMYDESNLLPACRQCNFYKSTFTIEQFRQRLKDVMMPNLQKDFRYRLAVKYGLIEEADKSIIFYYETLRS